MIEDLTAKTATTSPRPRSRDHPAMSNALDVLAGALEMFGTNAEAEVLMREALDIAVRKYSAVHIDTARVQNNLARLLGEMVSRDGYRLGSNVTSSTPARSGP